MPQEGLGVLVLGVQGGDGQELVPEDSVPVVRKWSETGPPGGLCSC